MHWEKKAFSQFGAYCQSKLANVLFTTELARRLEGTGVTSVSLHPGFVATEIFRDRGDKSWGTFFLMPVVKVAAALFARKSSDGAGTSIFCAIDDSIPSKNGLYFE